VKKHLLVILMLCSVCLGCAFGPRVVSALGVSAVTTDRIAQAAYETRANLVLSEARQNDETFEWYCAEVQEVWDDLVPPQCAAVALADLALAGNDLVSAGADLDSEWLGHACGAVRAAVGALEAAGEEVPSVLSGASDLLCSGAADPPDLDCLPEVVPGCEEVVP